MQVIMFTCGAVLILTCTAYFAYEVLTFRHSMVGQLSVLGEIISANSTAALAFDNQDDADEILSALKAEQHIVAAGLYDINGNLFSHYPQELPDSAFPSHPKEEEFRFEQSHLSGFQPVMLGDKRIGTLYLQSDLGSMYSRLRLYSGIAFLVIAFASLLAYFLSRRLQESISKPILALTETAKVISDHKDYSVRATKLAEDEMGLLTDAFNDMLEQIQRQNFEITSFNQKLEQKVAERTNELEVANRELEAFSYSVSHDLRSPLRSIHGYMNIFLEEYADKFDDEGKRLIDIILKNGQKMGQLIDDLLAFSRLGRKDLMKATISMNDVVRSTWEEFKKLEDQRAVELILHELPEVTADSVTIKQVWANLISNALKYTRCKDKARIEIGSEQNDNTIIYYVKDNGAGFDMQYYNKLFGVFQRLHSQEEFEGTGVGLAIVQRIITKHQGIIWADAKLNEGATFYFSLPKDA